MRFTLTPFGTAVGAQLCTSAAALSDANARSTPRRDSPLVIGSPWSLVQRRSTSPRRDARRDRGRNGEAERLRRRAVDDELEVGGLLDRQARGVDAAQDLVDVDRGPAKNLGDVLSIGHKHARLDVLLLDRHGGKPSPHREIREDARARYGRAEQRAVERHCLGPPATRGRDNGFERSEERRVGKERRARWRSKQEK